MKRKLKNFVLESVRCNIIERSSELDLKTIDSGIKNRWNWNWLTEIDLSDKGDFLSDYTVKINKPGAAYCLYCSIDIVYGSSGKRNLRKHALNDVKHAEQRGIQTTNMTLLKVFFEHNDDQSLKQTCSLPYVAPSNVHNNIYVQRERLWNQNLLLAL